MKARANEEWLCELEASGEEQAAALEDLRAYLLRAALYTLNRYRGDLGEQSHVGIESLAEDCAQDAMLAILDHLHEFRGDSKFTTWAYKFAVNIALVTARRERWKSVSLDQLLGDADSPDWPAQIEQAPDPDRPALQKEIWATLREAIGHDLTERQRLVVKAIVFDEVPVDEIARHLNSNRNAIYKLLHDARRKLRANLEAHGFGVQDILVLFTETK